ncbi:hypothetical protein FB45DRAFT_1006225 [Roridomyces roridus]|uniref:TEA domain-containing protein n=1 Tax=Roridomyces roridus TaxID=1738132 RepID=A0AAD7BJ18_9AGAR|nr:hypothetical protein FB45DRAFT_1006225 [Roridomyces roridus]
MYDSYLSDSSSSAGCSTPPSPFSDLPSPPLSHRTCLPPPLQSETAKEVFQSVLKVRKTWKTIRGGETVWPPELEAALVEGLEKYVPDDSRETRMLGRFPRRNRYISEYILKKTGKSRTAKQVGSRLQQLRESCTEQKLLHLLSPFCEPAETSPPPPDASSSFEDLYKSPPSRHTVIYIDILPEGSMERATSPSPWSDDGDVIRASAHPRRLHEINPTVSFTSRTPLIAHSQFTVYSEDLILHAESVALELVGKQADGSFIYSTVLVPQYWPTILNSPDPSRFTIFHEVIRDSDASLVFSATYKFSYPAMTLSPPLDAASFMMPPPLGYDAPAHETTPLPPFSMLDETVWNALRGCSTGSDDSASGGYLSPDLSSLAYIL